MPNNPGVSPAHAITAVSRLSAQAFEAGQIRAALVLAQMAALLEEPELWRIDPLAGPPAPFSLR